MPHARSHDHHLAWSGDALLAVQFEGGGARDQLEALLLVGMNMLARYAAAWLEEPVELKDRAAALGTGCAKDITLPGCRVAYLICRRHQPQ